MTEADFCLGHIFLWACSSAGTPAAAGVQRDNRRKAALRRAAERETRTKFCRSYQ